MALKSNKKTQKKQSKKERQTRDEKKRHLIDDIPSTEYDKIFEQKLAEQYRLFRNLKEHHMQTKKFIRILVILLVIILATILLISFSG